MSLVVTRQGQEAWLELQEWGTMRGRRGDKQPGNTQGAEEQRGRGAGHKANRTSLGQEPTRDTSVQPGP